MNGLRTLTALAAALVLIALVACTRDVVRKIEVPGKTVVVEKEVIKEVELPPKTVVVETEVVKEVEVPAETIVVEKVVVKEVPVKETVIKEVPVERVVEKEVVKEVPVEVVVEKVVVKEIEVPAETVVVEKEVVKEVPVEVVVEREIVKEIPVEVVVEKEIVKEVPVEVVVEKEIVKEIPVEVVVEKEIVKEVPVQVVVEVPTQTKMIAHRVDRAVSKLSPFRDDAAYVRLINNMIMSRLWQVDPHEQRYIPDIVERWEIAPDGSSVTFYMREDAFWHDGEPVTAEDVRWTFESYMSPWPWSRYGQELTMVKGARAAANGAGSVEGIVLIDDHTIRFDMEYPTGQFMPAAGGPILPSHILSEIAPEDLDEHDYFTGLGPQKPIGSGPWVFADHVPGQLHVLDANPSYYLGRPNIDHVVVYLIPDPEAAHYAMQVGEIDVNRSGSLTPEINQSLLDDPRFLVAATGERINGGGYSFNFRTDWIRDARIHQAHIWALDRRQLVNTFHDGLRHIHNTSLFLPSGVETPEMRARYTPNGDTARARQLLEQAGWDFDREVTVRSPAYTGPILSQFAAEKQMLADAGLKIEHLRMDTPAWASIYYETYNYDSVRASGWGGAIDALDYYFHSDYTDAMGYASPELDALMDAVPRALTNDELVDIGIRINEMFIEDLPIVVISSPVRVFSYGAHVWVPGFGRRPQPNRIEDLMFTPEFHSQHDSWSYMSHEINVAPVCTTHPLNETGPLARQVAVQLGQ